MERTPPVIGHLDADCFYISAERVRNSFLKGKPVGVLGNQGAFVIAKSYEMKAAGVKTGEPIWEALTKCPDGVYVKRDFRWYEVLSRRMLDVVREFSPEVEYYSIDEFFFRVLPSAAGSFQATAELMRDRILEEVGVPVTVGMARTKTLAKLVSDTSKPFGAVALLDRDAERALLDRTAVGEVCGIGGRRTAKLAENGILTALDFALAERRFVRQLLTVVGEGLWYEVNGEAVQPIHSTRPPHKMLARGGAIGKPTADPNYVWGWVVRCLERLIEELEYHCVRPGRLEMWVMYYDGQTHRQGGTAGADGPLRSAAGGDAGGHASGVAAAASGGPDQLDCVAVALAGSGAAGLVRAAAGAGRGAGEAEREVNARHGRFALRSGSTLFVNEFYKDEASGYEVCDVRGKICF